jgi:WD40 repeat protein
VVTVSFAGWEEGLVAPSLHEVEVVAPKLALKLEPVSSRLKRSLVHPNRGSVLRGLRYSPDGKRIIAGDYPGGIIQVWDTETGRQLTKIEAGYGLRGSAEYFSLTPDWKTVYVSREKRKSTRIEKNGKRLIRSEFDGDVRAWDLETGELRTKLQHKPPRNIIAMNLSPDGSSFLTTDELPGEWEGRAPRSVSLWNVATGEYEPLGDVQSYGGEFSPDSRTVAVLAFTDDKHYTTAINLFDVATGKEKLSIPVTEKFASAGVSMFAPDGDTLIGHVQAYADGNDFRKWQTYLKFWDTESGQEVASFPAEEENTGFLGLGVSPDGQLLLAKNWRGTKSKLYFFDVPNRKLVKTIVLGEKSFVRPPVFSPDRKWIAVTTQVFPTDVRGPAVEDVPQPRILLIDAVAGEVRETILAPQGFATSACFSPDGKTLATGGYGKVLLWDLTTPPGGSE